MPANAAARQALLTFERTVPRSIAHRRAVGEVFVTDSEAVSDDEFLLAWQIPRAHALWGDRQVPFHDPFSVAEAARQGSFVVVHRHLGIPLELPFTLRRFAFQVPDLEPFRDNRHSPLQGLLAYRLSDRRFQGDELGGMTIHGDIVIDGRPAMTVEGDVVFMSRDDYTALRAFQRSRKLRGGIEPWRPARPVAPELVGRADRRNVVVGEPAATSRPADPPRYPLVVDRTHPSYFDHDYDHVPGPFIVEGFRQTALLAANRSGDLTSPAAALTGLSTTFTDFGEFEAPLEYSAHRETGTDGRVHVRVGLHQFGSEIAEGRIDLTPYP